jgi:hypothetical protein
MTKAMIIAYTLSDCLVVYISIFDMQNDKAKHSHYADLHTISDPCQLQSFKLRCDCSIDLSNLSTTSISPGCKIEK